jgi:Fe-S cluster biogenesis protein NfuA
MSALDTKDLMIRTLPTPNPFALKFVLNTTLKEQGKATFNAAAECDTVPLARDLFVIPGVKQVHLFQNTLTVTHSGDLENDELDAQVTAVIHSRFPLHDPNFGEAQKPVKERPEHIDPLLTAVEDILDRTIRPGLQADGGDVEVVGFENNELRILYQGACGGCPSAMMGTLDAIQGILRNELNNSELIVVPI